MIWLKLDVPFASFRPYRSRDFQESFSIPPPSTVYGSLLSYLGITRDQKAKYRGSKLILAVESLPLRSVFLRKMRRGDGLMNHHDRNCRPEYQEVLVELVIYVGIKGELAVAFKEGFANPQNIKRFGGWALGESSNLINSVNLIDGPPAEALYLCADKRGFHQLTTWVDHVGNNSVYQRFDIRKHDANDLDSLWVEI